MKGNEDQSDEKSKAYFFRVRYTARESATIICVLAETQRQAENGESFVMRKGRRQMRADWRMWHGGGTSDTMGVGA